MQPKIIVSDSDPRNPNGREVFWNDDDNCPDDLLEDEVLREQVKLNGIDKWAKIATHLCGKTSRQCRRRWHMFLNVVNKRGGWSADEDKLLLEAHRKFGNRWTEIAKKLPGRTDNAVKNRFCVLCKKQTKEAESTPLQRCVDSRLDDGKQKLDERRFLEDSKSMHGYGGVNKKMRTESSLHNSASEVGLKHRPLDRTLQQWKGLKSSEVLKSSPHLHRSMEQSLQPWESLHSGMLLQQSTHDNRFHCLKQLALEEKSSGSHSQTPLIGSLQQWGGVAANDSISTSSVRSEPESSQVMQSQIPSVSPSSHRRHAQENLEQWVTAQRRGGSTECRLKSHSTWCSDKTIYSANKRSPHEKPVHDLVQWWKGLDVKDTMSDSIVQQKEVDDALHHWEQNSLDSVAKSINQHRSVDENLPMLSEMSFLAMECEPNSRQSILMGGIQRWSTVQSGNPNQPNADGVQSWDTSMAKEDWRVKEPDMSHRHHSSHEYNMQIDEPSLEHSVHSVSFQHTIGQHLSVWVSANCQEHAGRAPVVDTPEEQQAHEWKHAESETTEITSHRLLDSKFHLWDKSDCAKELAPIMDRLNHFSGSDANLKPHLRSSLSDLSEGCKSELIEEPWKTAVEKLKCEPRTLITDTEPQFREVVRECTAEGDKEDHLKTVTSFPTSPISSNSISKPANSVWDVETKVKHSCDGELHHEEGILSENGTTCETRIELCKGPNDKVEVMKTEEEASGVSGSPEPCVSADGAQSPSQMVSKAQLPMECIPSPQFSDSEKEFLLTTLDQRATNSWPTSPLQPHPRLAKVRAPLIDSRYDTPARSPLSSCLLRQFQITETSRLA